MALPTTSATALVEHALLVQSDSSGDTTWLLPQHGISGVMVQPALPFAVPTVRSQRIKSIAALSKYRSTPRDSTTLPRPTIPSLIAWLRDGARTILKVDFVQQAALDLRAAGNPTQQPEDAPTVVVQSAPFDIRNLPTHCRYR
jgi:hypothetical protein